MSIKLDLDIPVDVDVTSPQQLHDFLITMKQVIEDIANKAQQMQFEIRTTAPSTDDLDEGSFVRAAVGGNNWIYTKKDGVILRWQIT